MIDVHMLIGISSDNIKYSAFDVKLRKRTVLFNAVTFPCFYSA